MEPKYPEDLKKVVELLQKLSKIDTKYPSELLAHRRATFLENALAVKVTADIERGNSEGGSSQGGSPPSAPNILLQSFVATTIVIGTIVVASVVRNQWLPLLRETTPTPLHSSVPALTSTLARTPTLLISPTASPTASPTVSPTALPTGTVIPPVATNLDPNATATATAIATEKGGNHNGQTKTPRPSKTPKP